MWAKSLNLQLSWVVYYSFSDVYIGEGRKVESRQPYKSRLEQDLYWPVWGPAEGMNKTLLSFLHHIILCSWILMQLCLVQSFYFKLRSMIPCCLCHLNFTVAVPEEELIQVTTGHDLPNKWLEAKMQNSLILATSFWLPGGRYCSGHDLWQGPDSGEATRQIHLQRSVQHLGFFSHTTQISKQYSLFLFYHVK